MEAATEGGGCGCMGAAALGKVVWMDLRDWKALEKDKQGEEQGTQPCGESKGTGAKNQGGIFLKRRDAGVGRAVAWGEERTVTAGM